MRRRPSTPRGRAALRAGRAQLGEAAPVSAAAAQGGPGRAPIAARRGPGAGSGVQGRVSRGAVSRCRPARPGPLLLRGACAGAGPAEGPPGGCLRPPPGRLLPRVAACAGGQDPPPCGAAGSAPLAPAPLAPAPRVPPGAATAERRGGGRARGPRVWRYPAGHGP